MSELSGEVVFEVHLGTDAVADFLRADVQKGLTQHKKSLPPKWFYDEVGSRLFDEITRLPEYYPTRREREILQARSVEIARLSRADVLVELGSGTSEKTRLLLNALEPKLRGIVILDVSESTLRSAAASLGSEYPGADITALVADFEHHMPHIPAAGRRLVAFLGGTIGNFRPTERIDLLRKLRAELKPGDSFLVGTDLVKDSERLIRAYDDSAGVTAAFNLNVLSVINRELSADFNLESFRHRAHFDPANEWIEMRLIADRDQRVRIAALDLEIEFAAGEEILTEISAKFTRQRVEAELELAGFSPIAWWTDNAVEFALSLWGVN